MIDVGDMRQFARAFGKWLCGINPDLKAERLEAMIRKFATSVPSVGDNSSLSIDEFVAEAVAGYKADEASA